MSRRGRRENAEGGVSTLKGFLYLGGGIIGIAVITFVLTYMIYGRVMSNKNAGNKTAQNNKITNVVSGNTNNNTKEASTSLSKGVNEVQNVAANIPEIVIQNATNEVEPATLENSETSTKTESVKPKTEEVKKELVFSKPVDGNVLKPFAKDTLVYSDTLREWMTHFGVDIAAEKTTVVKAAADGTVKSIKNDPRYGVTVVIEHSEGFTTIYANLLTAEFVKEGETVKSGQSVGTVGNSAAFESQDLSHFHFEMMKDGEYVDPCIYVYK